MARTIMGAAAVSQDGFIADVDDGVGPLFDWLGNGDVEWAWTRVTRTSCAHRRRPRTSFEPCTRRSVCVVTGRRLFDLTDGWDGVPAAATTSSSSPTSRRPTGSTPAPRRSPSSTGSRLRSTQAREFAGPDRIVDVAAGQIGGQALRLGLIDQVVMNVVPVVFGAGKPFFGAMGPGDSITLDNPSRVAQGDRVTHLLYDVAKG